MAVFAIHACNYLSDVITDAAVSAGAPFAVMPCCHADRSKGALKQAAALVGITMPEALDIARMGALLGDGYSGYSCHMFSIPPDITPVNRILLGIPPPPQGVTSPPVTTRRNNPPVLFTDKQHEALMSQYSTRNAHSNGVQSRGAGGGQGGREGGRGGREVAHPRMRFTDAEHAALVQRALALSSKSSSKAAVKQQ